MNDQIEPGLYRIERRRVSSISGFAAANSAAARLRTRSPNPQLQLMRSFPFRVPRADVTASSRAAIRSRMSSAPARNRFPSPVSAIPRVLRSTRGQPNRVSIAASRRDTAPAVSPRRRAASERLPLFAIAEKSSRSVARLKPKPSWKRPSGGVALRKAVTSNVYFAGFLHAACVKGFTFP